jgi:hypothetical protein
MRSLFFALCAAGIFLISPARAAEESVRIGTIAAVEGSASVTHTGGKPQTLKINDPVYLDDEVATGAASRAHILFIDDTEVTLGENATFSADDYMFDEKDHSADKAHYNALRGTFIYVGGLIDKNKNASVDTPYGSVGVRGTAFWGGAVDGKYGVLCAAGAIAVRNKGGEVLVKSGEGTDLKGKAVVPTAARAWSQDRIDRAKRTVALADLAAVQKRVMSLKAQNPMLRARFERMLKMHPVLKKQLELQNKLNGDRLLQQREDQIELNREQRLQREQQLQPQKQLLRQQLNQPAYPPRQPAQRPALQRFLGK